MKDLLHIKASELEALGIVEWGYTSEMKPRSFDKFETWLKTNGAELVFLLPEKNRRYRSDLREWWPEARSALVFLFSYAPAKKALLDERQYKVAGYALGFDGADYHPVMKQRLHVIGRRLQEGSQLQFKHSHDTEPILERDLAQRAGLGWFGKNSLMINRQLGSYFMLGSLILDRELALEVPAASLDHCGSCHACVDACPTQAIDPDTRTITAGQCISTWTIEDRRSDTAAPRGLEAARGELFGCDICQDVCPWNHKGLAAVVPALGARAREWLAWFKRPSSEIAGEVMPLTNRGFLRLMEGTPFGRPGRPSLLRTLSFWIKKG